MVETQTKVITGLIGIVLILAGFGGNELLTEDQYKNAYVCTVTEGLGIFDRLSSTLYRGYPTPDTTVGYKDCKNKETLEKGIWRPLKEYAEEKGVDPLTFILKESEDEEEKIVYIDSRTHTNSPQEACDKQGCFAI